NAALRREVKIIVNSLVVQPWTLRLGPVVLVGVVLRRPSRVRREAVMDELPREVETRRGASRSEEARAGVAPRRERRRHRGRRGTRHRRAHGVVGSSGALRGDPIPRARVRPGLRDGAEARRLREPTRARQRAPRHDQVQDAGRLTRNKGKLPKRNEMRGHEFSAGVHSRVPGHVPAHDERRPRAGAGASKVAPVQQLRQLRARRPGLLDSLATPALIHAQVLQATIHKS
ncbi:unnamed protein product, partial [Pelagomonas calceolata]